MKRDTDHQTEAAEPVSGEELLDAGHHLPAQGSNLNEVSIRVHSLKADVTGLAMHRGVASVLLGDGHDPSTMLSTFVGDCWLQRSSLRTAVSGATSAVHRPRRRDRGRRPRFTPRFA
jgi:hypothetical protein